MIIKEAWEDYTTRVLAPSGSDLEQIEEAKISFYAGAISIFNVLLNLSPEEAENVINSMDEEFIQYTKELQYRQAKFQREGIQ